MLAQLARVIAGDVLPSDILAAVAAPFAQPVYSIYWSPLLVAPLIVLAFVATPFGWAYWLGRWQSTKVDHGWVWAMTIVVTVGAAVGAVVANAVVPLSTTLRVLLIVLAIVGALTLPVAVGLSGQPDGDANRVSGQRSFRNLASRAFSSSAALTAARPAVARLPT